MAKKKYALNNSYFKNRGYNDPETILEIAKYQQEHNELPFDYHGDNWVYDAFCERQKRSGVYHQQFLTPDATAQRLVQIASNYAGDTEKVLDACCGTGQLTKQLINENFKVEGFDFSSEMIELCQLLYPEQLFYTSDYKYCQSEVKYPLIVSNPPYDVSDLTEFLEWINKHLTTKGIAVLLIPNGFLDKTRPKKIVEVLNNFAILEREAMTEEFARTKIRAEIVVLQKI
jgi:trans-aconitate methyltransferase